MKLLKKSLFILIAVFLTFNSAEAALEKTKKFSFFQNNGGLNDKLSPIVIKDNEASALENVEFSLGGAIKKRDGFSSNNSANIAPVTGLYQYIQSDGTEFFIATGGDTIYQQEDFDGVFDDITGTVTIASDSTVLFDFTTANGNLIATNQSNPVITWDGTGNVSTISDAPQGKYIEFHQNIVFIANTITDTTAASDVQPSRLYFSNVLDEDAWTSTDFIDVGKDDGSGINGLAILLDTLYIFKENAVYRLSGTNRDDFILSRMVNGIGAVGGFSIQTINNRIIFQARDGIYIYDGGINVKKISSRIEDTLDDLDETKYVNSTSANFKRVNQYWLSVTEDGQTTPDTILVYDYFHDAWTKFTGIEANVMTTVIDENDKEQLYTGDVRIRGGAFKQNDGDNDDGAVINASYTTKWYRFPEIRPSDKVVRLLRVFAKAVGTWSLTVDSKQDFASSTASDTVTLAVSSDVYDTGKYGTARYGGDIIIIGRIHLELRESFFQFKFSNNFADQPFTIFGWSIYVEETGRI